MDVQTISGAGTAAAVDALIARMYGGPLPDVVGALHVAAVYERQGVLHVLKIRQETPKSAHDFFALNLARARADAIVVSGKILRDEPGLSYSLQGPGLVPQGLAGWRREVAARPRPPRLAILTSGRDLPLGHPAFSGWASPVVYTSRDGADRLASSRVEVIPLEQPSIRTVLEDLLGRGHRTISIEAGPTTARQLYDPPMAVAELMLSTYRGAVPDVVRGPHLLSRHELEQRLPHFTAPVSVGGWQFERRWAARLPKD